MIAIINTGVANLTSVELAFKRLGADVVVTRDKNSIQNASHVVMPGVGTAHTAMNNLQQFNLIEIVRRLSQPVLGICLGMQLQYQYSEEGDVACLSLVTGKIKKFVSKKDLVVPHMGWNKISIQKPSPLLNNVPEQSYVYFVHSYADFSESEYRVATSVHGEQFTAVMQYKNFFGTQFHPERSGKIGELILKNFLEIK